MVADAVASEPVSLLFGGNQRFFRQKQRASRPTGGESLAGQAFLTIRLVSISGRNREAASRNNSEYLSNEGCYNEF
jgi:hypothetical protein